MPRPNGGLRSARRIGASGFESSFNGKVEQPLGRVFEDGCGDVNFNLRAK
jgi:hypothetical protein